MPGEELVIKAILDLTQFNKAIDIANAAIASVVNGIKEIGVGALRYIGELTVRAFMQAGRAVLNFARDVAGAAFENHALHGTLDSIYNSLVDVTRVTFTPLLNQINMLTAKAAPAFLGVVQRAEEYLADLASDALGYGEGVASSFAQGIWNGFVYVVDALTGLGSLIASWLMPGSPPRILPDLDRWGAEAMNVYLSGWANADFGIFNKISGTLTALIRSFADPLGKGEGVIPQILGTREGIAKAVDELRRTGTITKSTLDSIIAGVGGAKAEVRGYLETLIALEAANADVARAQAAVNVATKAYEDLLRPIDKQVAGITESQQQLTEEQEKGRLALILKSRNISADEKRAAQLRIEQIDAERARRAAIVAGQAAVDTAKDQLTAAQAAQEVAKDNFDAETARLQILAETNDLIASQIKLMDRLSAAVKDAASGGAKGAGGKGGGGGFKVDTSWIDDLVSKVQAKLEELKAAWTTAWQLLQDKMKPFTDFINGPLREFLLRLWNILAVEGRKAIEIIVNWWDSTMLPALKRGWAWIDEHIIPLFRDMWHWLEERLPPAVQATAEAFNRDLLPKLLEVVRFATTELWHAFTGIWEWLEEKLPGAADTLAKALTAIINASRQMADFIMGHLAEVRAAIDLTIAAISSLLSWQSAIGTGVGIGSNLPSIVPPNAPGSHTTNNSDSHSTTNNFNLNTNTTQSSNSIIQDFAAMNVWGAI